MKVLVPVKRVVDFNVKVRVKPDGSGVDLAERQDGDEPVRRDRRRGGACASRKPARRPRWWWSRSARRRRPRRSAPASPWAPTAASWSRPTSRTEPLGVAKALKAVVARRAAGPRHPRQAGDRRRLQPDRPDARRPPRLAAGDLCLEARHRRRRRDGDARGRRRPRDAPSRRCPRSSPPTSGSTSRATPRCPTS